MTTSASRKARIARRGKPSSSSSLTGWIIGAGVFFVLLIGLVVYLNSRPTVIPVTELNVPADWVERTTLGDPNAQVTVQVWEDFLCPHCQNWTAQVKPQLVEQYIDTGLARLEFRNMPLPGFQPGSGMGAQASQCAADQGKFWPFHDALFDAGRTRGQTGFTYNALVEMATRVGLDTADFQECMSSQRHASTLGAIAQEANELQVNSTPTMFINGKRIADPFNFSLIQAEIDALLASAS
jgi:protein-disulfide isomerase